MMVDILSWRLCLGDAAAKPTKCDFNLACRMAQRQGYIWLTLGSWLACLGRKVVALKSDGRAMYSPPPGSSPRGTILQPIPRILRGSTPRSISVMVRLTPAARYEHVGTPAEQRINFALADQVARRLCLPER
jgi:hypothetical protein